VAAVSVIVSCYHLGQFLDETVQSVLAQTYQDFEIIVVDDGSTDPFTQTMLATYSAPKTRVIRTAHRGLAAARNTGIDAASGEYLCALDADDRLQPAFLERVVGVLDGDRTLTFCSSWLRTFGDEQWDWTPGRCDLPTLLWENTVLTAAVVRRAAVVDLGGYDTGMPEQGDEDWDLWLRLVAAGHRGTIVPEVLFDYRRRAGSMSTVCWYGNGHLPLLRYRVAKHRTQYDAHLHDVLLHQDEATSALLRRNDELERHLASNLEPALALREAELQSLENRLARLDHSSRHLSNLESALAASVAEVDAFKQSMSWRVTAPLRTAYGWWLKWTGA
jgi:glycosyltransferase involved in cell wall biosynthesis